MIHEELLKIPQYKIILLNTFGVTVFFPLVFSCLHFIAFIGYTEHKQRSAISDIVCEGSPCHLGHCSLTEQ